MRSFISLSVVTFAFAVNGCTQQPSDLPGDNASSTSDTAAATINKNCPVMGSPVTDDGGRYDWNGKNVGFCCPGCIEAFAELSDEDKTEAIADADKSTADDGAHQSHDHDHDHGESEAS